MHHTATPMRLTSITPITTLIATTLAVPMLPLPVEFGGDTLGLLSFEAGTFVDGVEF